MEKEKLVLQKHWQFIHFDVIFCLVHEEFYKYIAKNKR